MKWLLIGLLGGVLSWGAVLYLDISWPSKAADRPLSVIPSKDPLRLAFVGTSLTAPYDWPDRLAECAGRQLDVSRIAQSGAASDWGREQVVRITQARPDIVVIEFSINDADLRRGMSRRVSRENHVYMITTLRAQLPEAQIVLMTMSPAHGLRRLLRPRLPSYYALYHDLGTAYDLGVLDLYPRWRALPKSARDLYDGLHPSEAAAAQVILPALAGYFGLEC